MLFEDFAFPSMVHFGLGHHFGEQAYDHFDLRGVAGNGRETIATTSSEENWGDDIVVIGIRPNGGGGYGGGTGQFELRDPDISIENNTEAPSPPPDCAEATFTPIGNVSWDATKLAAISTIGDALKELLDRIGSLPADAAFGSTGGIAIADTLFELLVLADWRISNFNFQNGTSQFGSTGAASWNFGDPRFTLSEAGLVQWGQSLEYARFYILHELAHVTPAGQNFVRIANETGTDESKVAAELWANSFALLLYNTLFESNPPFGQAPEPGFSAEFFYQTSPGDPNGETAEEAFEGCEP